MRAIFFLGFTVLLTIVVSIICMILSVLFGRFSWPPRRMMRIWAKLLIWGAGVKVEVHGLEAIDFSQNYIVVSNHQSLLDLPLLISLFPLRMTVVAKKELFWIPIFGWGMWFSGILPIDRKNLRKAIQVLDRLAEILIHEKLSLLIFPEGTRTRDGNLLPFRKGSFALAKKVGLPLLPVKISGNFEILPKTTFFVRPGKVKCEIFPAIRDYDHLSSEQLLELTRNLYLR